MNRMLEMHCRAHMENMFLYFAAPILRGVKPAWLLTMHSECLAIWRECKADLCEETGLKTVEIVTGRGAVLLLIYDESALERVLCDHHAAELLDDCGYPVACGLEQILSCLQMRFAMTDFPHEVGAFLGYPIEDVNGFIENRGRNFVACRYWKVYHNADRALETFRRIDEAKNYAMELLTKPMPFHIAVRLLKAV